ncbi:hypothetical protein SCLARK_001473 [Spiroplasma clarkii]|uniref:Transposase n=1 Tax=Spiroplasma clarkii TaxID=2139 RepID=A0A1Y0L2J8_9MOLU|nr:transposase [Spiroplasma clarkii]ARU91990.1 hypothetical protein SCLARK_001473 [Spiroplasma clarkii]ATX71328.1 transposase [Spiroplasma clarkii]
MGNYSPKQKEKIILKFRQDKVSVKWFVKSYGITGQTLLNWCKKYDQFGIDGLGLQDSANKEELINLRNENKELKKKNAKLELRDEVWKKIELLISKKK